MTSERSEIIKRAVQGDHRAEMQCGIFSLLRSLRHQAALLPENPFIDSMDDILKVCLLLPNDRLVISVYLHIHALCNSPPVILDLLAEIIFLQLHLLPFIYLSSFYTLMSTQGQHRAWMFTNQTPTGLMNADKHIHTHNYRQV